MSSIHISRLEVLQKTVLQVMGSNPKVGKPSSFIWSIFCPSYEVAWVICRFPKKEGATYEFLSKIADKLDFKLFDGGLITPRYGTALWYELPFDEFPTELRRDFTKLEARKKQVRIVYDMIQELTRDLNPTNMSANVETAHHRLDAIHTIARRSRLHLLVEDRQAWAKKVAEYFRLCDPVEYSEGSRF